MGDVIMTEVERFKELAKIWHKKGRKAFNNAIEHGIPNWNEFFEKEWNEFITMKVRCLECGNIKTWEINLNYTLDKKADLERFVNLGCPTCNDFVDIEKWIMVK